MVRARGSKRGEGSQREKRGARDEVVSTKRSEAHWIGCLFVCLLIAAVRQSLLPQAIRSHDSVLQAKQRHLSSIASKSRGE